MVSWNTGFVARSTAFVVPLRVARPPTVGTCQTWTDKQLDFAEVDQACACEAEHAVHNDGVLLPCVAFRTCGNCGHCEELRGCYCSRRKGKLEPTLCR